MFCNFRSALIQMCKWHACEKNCVPLLQSMNCCSTQIFSVALLLFKISNSSCYLALTYWHWLGKTEVCVWTWMQYYKDMNEWRVCTTEVWHACQTWLERRSIANLKKKGFQSRCACMLKRAWHGVALSVLRPICFGIRHDNMSQAYSSELGSYSLQQWLDTLSKYHKKWTSICMCNCTVDSPCQRADATLMTRWSKSILCIG